MINDNLNGIIEDINRLKHYDWTDKDRAERVHYMQRAKELNRENLDSVSFDNFQARMYLAGQQGIIEHYLEICEKPVEVQMRAERKYFN